jgi:hypothetical protein
MRINRTKIFTNQIRVAESNRLKFYIRELICYKGDNE